MDVNKMLAALRAELEQIDEAIVAVERIAAGSGKRRGRPPRWLAAVREGKPESSAKPKRKPSKPVAAGE